MTDIDLRTDIPSYKVFEQGRVVSEVKDITALWRDDLVAVFARLLLLL